MIDPPAAPNSSASRADTAADSESGSVQPPALSAPVTPDARVDDATATTIDTRAMGRRKR